jgi:iron complex outermembrane receptor protein/vitamin B12 transporter
MPVYSLPRRLAANSFIRAIARALPCLVAALTLTIATTLCPAASIRGTVTDASGAKVTGATVVLVSNGNVVASVVSMADGSFQILTGISGRFFLVVSAQSFRQLETPGFYAGQLDNIERNVVLEPAWVRESIVVTATGTPTPQPQATGTTSVLGPLEIGQNYDLVAAMRMMPGTTVEQDGELGAQTSLFIRGGDSTDNKFLVDGVSAGDLGGRFDLGPLSTTAIQSAEVYRGPDSNLYGADAGSGVIGFTTPHGTTSFPSLMFAGDAGSFTTSREELELAGAHNKFDYLGAFSWLQTANTIPMDEYHVATTAANLGWQPSGTTQIRGTLRYGVDATGVPNAWDFYGLSDDRKEGDQDLYVGGSLDNQTTLDFHNHFQYGLTRKREQSVQWYGAGICIPAGSCDGAPDTFTGGNFYGLPITIQGANGYSIAGPALLNYSAANGSVYPNRLDLISNRDQFNYQGDFRITPHLVVLGGFQYENERGAEREPAYFIDQSVNRDNYDYIVGVHGDFKTRFFYTLGGSIEHYQLIGNGISPHAGFGYYILRPKNGIFSGTRVNFNYAQGVREPALTEEFGSLNHFLLGEPGGPAAIRQFHISPIEAPTTRTYEGGGEQAFWSQRILFRASYFHNEFGRDIESVPAQLIPIFLPGLTPTQQQALEGILLNDEAFSLDLNSLAFRAQGIEATVESGIGKNIFLRGGYTYLDSMVQQTFLSNNPTLVGSELAIFDGIPAGIDSPLKGARPFRRPPHTAFFSASYASKGFTAVFRTALQSRADDSTFLGFSDLEQGNSLVLPNRNLDFGFAKLDLGGSYQFTSWLGIYAQADNLTSDRHIAPVGYPSLPFTLRGGLKIVLGKGSGK